MADRPIDALDSFETRLAQDLRSLSAVALRSVDAVQVAHGLAAADSRRRVRLLPGFPPRARLGARPRVQGFVAGLAAALVVFALVGLGATLMTRAPGFAAEPSPSPSASPLVGRAVVDLAEIQSPWTSIGTRKSRFVNGSHSSMVDAQVNVVMGPGTISIAEFRDNVVNSIALDGAGALQVRLMTAAFDWTCVVGDQGAYAVRLSPTDQIMTLTLLDDACPERAAVLAGAWNRTDIGPLAAGKHVSKLFRPFGTTGQLSYTVPTGWEETNECTRCFSLWKQNHPAGLMIYVIPDVVPTTNGEVCRDMMAGAGSTPAGIAAWLASIQNLDVTKPSPVTVGGLRGVSIDLSVRTDIASAPCGFLVDSNGDVTLADPDSPDPRLSVPGAGRDRYLLLDRGDGRTLVIVVETEDGTTSDAATLAEAMRIVESFEFDR